MERWRARVVRLGAELGPEPAEDLLPTAATTLALLAVERQAEEAGEGDAEAEAAVAALHRVLGRTPRPWCGPALDAALSGLDPTWAPVQAVRLAAALAAGLLAGHLPAGRPWAVHVVDPVGAAAAALGPVVDLLAGLLDGWDPTLAPPAVVTNLGSVRRSATGYSRAGERLGTLPDLWVELDPWAGPADPLPGWRDAPVVTVRVAAPAAADPGLPPSPGAPPVPGPALAAVAAWCGLPGERAAAADGLFERSWPLPDPRRDHGTDGPSTSGAVAPWEREAADLHLAARPELASSWCLRARAEAGHPAGSRARHRRLLAGAAATGPAAGDLRDHAALVRAGRRPAWALDVWAVAGDALAADLAADVVAAPPAGPSGEAALALAVRLEAVAAVTRGLARTGGDPRSLPPGQTAG